MMAFVGGLLLGLLGSLLLDWPGYLFVLIAPLFLGMLGSLTVGPRKKRPKLGGLSIGVISWFGVWLSVLAWESFQPQRVTDCLLTDAPCHPTTVPFWGEYTELFLFVFLLSLGVGLVTVLGSWFISSIVFDVVRRRATRRKSSQ